MASDVSAEDLHDGPRSGLRRQCHLLLFVPLQFQCQQPCQPDDKQPVSRRDGERIAGCYGRAGIRHFMRVEDSAALCVVGARVCTSLAAQSVRMHTVRPGGLPSWRPSLISDGSNGLSTS